MKLTERLSPGVARGVIFARPGSLHPVFTSVVVGTASARRVAWSTLLQVASSSSRPTPSIRSLRPAQHPASACFGPPSTLPHLASARPAVNAVCVVRNAMRKRDCVSHVALREGTLLEVPRASPREYASFSSSSSLPPPSALPVRAASRGQ